VIKKKIKETARKDEEMLRIRGGTFFFFLSILFKYLITLLCSCSWFLFFSLLFLTTVCVCAVCCALERE